MNYPQNREAAKSEVLAAIDRLREQNYVPSRDVYKEKTVNRAKAVVDTHFEHLLTLIPAWETEDGCQPGGPTKFGYSVLLLGMILAAEDGLPMFATAIVDVLWHKIPVSMRASLGIPDPPPCTSTTCTGNACKHPDRALVRNVRTRMRSLERLVDPYGLPTGHALDPADAEADRRVYAAGERERCAERLTLLANTVVEASLRQMPRELWDDWDGTAAVDETAVRPYARPPKTAVDPTKPKRNGRHQTKVVATSTEPSAGWYARDGKYKWSWEFTLISMSSCPADDGLQRRPNLVLAVAPLTAPGTGAAPSAVAALRSTRYRGRPVTWLSNDRLYTSSRPELYQQICIDELDIMFIHDYRVDQLGIQGQHEGVILVDGALYCADMDKSLISATYDYRTGVIDWPECQKRLAGRKNYKLRLKDGPDRLLCPAAGACPTAGCAHKPQSLTIRTKPLPRVNIVNNTPATGPDGTTSLPAFCSQGSVTLPAHVAAEFNRFRQPYDYLSDEWLTWYRSGRSTIEGFNGFSKDAAFHGIGVRDRRRMRGAALNTIFLAFLVYAANIRKINGFLDHMEATQTPSGRWVIHRPRKRNTNNTKIAPPYHQHPGAPDP